MNKILVIHPKDKTTDFLKPIYNKLKNPTVITGDLSREAIIEHIKNQICVELKNYILT